MKTLHFGGIDFINAYPLVRTLPPDRNSNVKVELTLAEPSQLYEKLLQHALDVAMIPTYSFFENALPAMSGNYVIASDGPVRSVCLYSQKQLEDGALIALDAKSRTSVRMLKILLNETGYQHIRYVSLPFEAMLLRKDIDAFLLIGDDNFQAGIPDLPLCIDLGKWWKETFDTPFIYAVIAAFEKENLVQVHPWLHENYKFWEKNRTAFVNTWCCKLNIPEPELLHYLTKNILHTLNPGQVESGVQLFQKLCVKYGLLHRINSYQVFF
jgi:chorismate dehydratase